MAWTYSYDELLAKARKELPATVFKSERFEMPRVSGGFQGNHTIINNFKQISEYLRREPEHLMKYLAGELATIGKIEGARVDFTGKFKSEEINKKLENYVNTFVRCSECGKTDTKLSKEERLTVMKCMVCGSKKPVRSLK